MTWCNVLTIGILFHSEMHDLLMDCGSLYFIQAVLFYRR